jgi:hypothetical protein
MKESPGHINGAAFALESAADVGGAADCLEKGPPISEGERKRMEENGGIRPGKKWPQYLAATLGTRLLVCLIFRVETERS